MSEHRVEYIGNDGWDDDPAWKVICGCHWETWDHATEDGARERHNEHRSDVILTGRCNCPTCLAAPEQTP